MIYQMLMLRKNRVLLRKRKKYIKNRNTFTSKTGKKTIMKSSWEKLYAKYLEKNNIYWEYETIGFKTSIGKYFPDFIIYKNNKIIEIVEIKGRLFPKAKIKMEQFRLLYPTLKFTVLFREDLKKLGIL